MTEDPDRENPAEDASDREDQANANNPQLGFDLDKTLDFGSLIPRFPGFEAQIAQILENVNAPLRLTLSAINSSAINSVTANWPEMFAKFAPAQADLVAALRPLYRRPLSSREYFGSDETSPSGYSPAMHSAGSYFEYHEEVIDDFEDLNRQIALLIKKNPQLDLVWRGQQNAAWGMHSNLFRRLKERNGVAAPGDAGADGVQNYPTEDEMVAAEKAMLEVARDQWRLDDSPALEVLARLQHHGAPTRLIDVTRNPYIAAWFAVERDPSGDGDESDARLFAFANGPVLGTDAPPIDTRIRMDETGSLRQPFWHAFSDSEQRRGADWGTGSKRRMWVPPAYDQRIVAQDAGFLLDGIPMISSKIAPYFKVANGGEYWRKVDLLAAASIYAKTARPNRKIGSNKPNLAPTFTFRVTAKAKDEIRHVLERRFSYNHATIYPDITGLAQYITKHLDDLA